MTDQLGRRTLLGSLCEAAAATLAYVFPDRFRRRAAVEKLNTIGRPLKLVGTKPVLPNPYYGLWLDAVTASREKLAKELAATIEALGLAVEAERPETSSPVWYLGRAYLWDDGITDLKATLSRDISPLSEEVTAWHRWLSPTASPTLLQAVITELVGPVDAQVVRHPEELMMTTGPLAGRAIGSRFRAPAFRVNLDDLRITKDERRFAWSIWKVAQNLRESRRQANDSALQALGDLAESRVHYARCLPLDVAMYKPTTNSVDIETSWWWGGVYLPIGTDPGFKPAPVSMVETYPYGLDYSEPLRPGPQPSDTGVDNERS